jgi:hypothetical protein
MHIKIVFTQVCRYMLIIPATWEVTIGRIAFPSQPGQNVSESPSTNKPSMVVHTFNPSYTGGEGRKTRV